MALRDVETDCADILAAADLSLELGRTLFSGPTPKIDGLVVSCRQVGGDVEHMQGRGAVFSSTVQVHISAPQNFYREGKQLADRIYSALWLVRTDSYSQILPEGAAPTYLGQDDSGRHLFTLPINFSWRAATAAGTIVPLSPNNEIRATTLNVSSILFGDGSAMSAAPDIPDVSGFLKKTGDTMTGKLAFSGIASGQIAVEIPEGARIVTGSGANDYFFSDGAYALRTPGALRADGPILSSDFQGTLISSTNPGGSNLTIRGNVQDSVNKPAVVINAGSGLTTAGRKILSIQNADAEKASFDKDGNLSVGTVYSNGYIYSSQGLAANGNTNVSVLGRALDGSNAIGVVMNNVTALTVAGSKLLSVRNGGTEKVAIDKDGRVSAQDGALASENYVQSRGLNLVTNGSGLLGRNFNFSGFTFDATELYAGGGSFYTADYMVTKSTDEYLPVDPQKLYELQFYSKSKPYVGARTYTGVSCYDIDKNSISPFTFMRRAGTDTTLAQPLKPGDTKIYLTSSANWQNGGGAGDNHSRSVVIYGWKNSKGYTYPDYTYSRRYLQNGWDDNGIDTVNHVITLRSPWPGSLANPDTGDGAWPAGTAVANNQSGGGYQYIGAVNAQIPGSWTRYRGVIGPVDVNGVNAGGTSFVRFPHGTAFVRLVFLVNRDTTGGGTHFSNVYFGETSGDYLLVSPNGTKYRLAVSDAGALTVTAL